MPLVAEIIMIRRGINNIRGEQTSESEAQARKGSRAGNGERKAQTKNKAKAKQNKTKRRKREQGNMRELIQVDTLLLALGLGCPPCRAPLH